MRQIAAVVGRTVVEVVLAIAEAVRIEAEVAQHAAVVDLQRAEVEAEVQVMRSQ